MLDEDNTVIAVVVDETVYPLLVIGVQLAGLGHGKGKCAVAAGVCLRLYAREESVVIVFPDI